MKLTNNSLQLTINLKQWMLTVTSQLLTVVRSAHSGQTLIEVLVVLGILGVILTAVATMIQSSVNNAQFTRNQTLATKYTQEGMEMVRKLRNQDYAAFRTFSGTYCLAKGQATLGPSVSSCSSPNLDSFVRSVQITQSACAPDVARVIVYVAWTDGKCSSNNDYCHRQEHSTCMSTLNPIQAP